MTAQDSDMEETARIWAIRVEDPAFDDWDGFTAWLEGDPSHLPAYEAALASTAWAEDVLSREPTAEPEDATDYAAPASNRRWFGIGGAIAACLALVGVWATGVGLPGEDAIVTEPGEHRTVSLADGSRVILNGNTRVELDPDDPRRLDLAYGEALFEIRHYESDPFIVTVGDTQLVDAGTVFNVIEDSGALEVAVAEGAVIYQLGRSEIRLDAGDGLTRAAADAEPVKVSAAPDAVGNWQTGLLQYDNASLDRVARDLSRNLGRPIEASAEAGKLRFTGTLVVSGTPAEALERSGALMGVQFQEQGDGWRMMPANEARR